MYIYRCVYLEYISHFRHDLGHLSGYLWLWLGRAFEEWFLGRQGAVWGVFEEWSLGVLGSQFDSSKSLHRSACSQ